MMRANDITLRIKAMTYTLTPAEKNIANYIIEHEKEIPYQSVQDIALNSDVSAPTVLRFINKIGFESLKDFKINLAVENASLVNAVTSQISEDDPEERIVEKVFNVNINNLVDTLKLLDVGKLMELAYRICEAEKTVFYGIGGSGYVAQDTMLRFSHLDIQVESYTDPIQMVISANKLNEKCVAVGISHSGNSVYPIYSLEVAKKRKAVTAAISNFTDSEIMKHADYKMITAFAGSDQSMGSASLSSHVAQLAIMDAIYIIIAKNKSNTKRFYDINNDIDQLLRVNAGGKKKGKGGPRTPAK